MAGMDGLVSVERPAYTSGTTLPTSFGNKTRATTIDHVLIPQELFENVAWSATLPQITLTHAGFEDHEWTEPQVREAAHDSYDRR